jgi:hypothetical protein
MSIKEPRYFCVCHAKSREVVYFGPDADEAAEAYKPGTEYGSGQNSEEAWSSVQARLELLPSPIKRNRNGKRGG